MDPEAGHSVAKAAKPGPASGLMGWLAGTAPTVLAVLGLGGAAYWGHVTEWRFAFPPPVTDSETNHHSADMAVARPGVPGPASSPPPGWPSGMSIVFPSAEAVDKAGIDIAPVWRTAMTESITASGEAQFDPTLVARISPRAPGTAWRVSKTVGDPVRAGEVLALVDAAEVGKAKGDFQQALVLYRLKRQALANLGLAQGVVPERQRREAEAALQEAEALLHASEQALAYLGIPARAADFGNLSLEEVVRRMWALGTGDLALAAHGGGVPANLFPVRTPIDGMVLEADAVTGEVVESSRVLFVVADPRRLSLTLHVGQDSVRKVAVGQEVEYRPDGSREMFRGRVAWVGAVADETTRKIPVRAEMANDAGRLRTSTLGQGRILVRASPDALVVPIGAVGSFGGVPVVFARHPDYLKPKGPKSFEPRAVRLGALDSMQVEVLSGLRDGDVVATRGLDALSGAMSRGSTGRQGGHADER